MKIFLFRISSVILAFAFGCEIFLILAYSGDKSKGPLSDLFVTVNTGVARIEKKMTRPREHRSAVLKWFDFYRNNPAALNKPDTLFWGAYDDNTAESYESIVALEDSLKINLPIISLYTAWGSKKNEVFPLLRAQAIYDMGSIPMITWEPWLNDFDPEDFPVNAKTEDKNKNGLREIAEGKFDGYIDEWAKDAKKFGASFFLRFGHEMNDPFRYPWGPQNNKPEEFIAAWRHVVDRFHNAGANNAVWVWSPNSAYSYVDFYPGQQYVDWIGTTAINYGTVATWSQWWSLDVIFKKFYDNASRTKKPIIITEFGSLSVGGDRAAWYTQALASLREKYPAVKSVVFFHVADDNTTTYKSLDWSFKNDGKVIKSIRMSLDSFKKR